MKTAMRKYEFTEETKTLCDGTVLHRIRALIDIDLGWKIVKAGELGGWVEKEGNLSHIGNCWVYKNAKVYGDARICGDSRIRGDAKVFGNAMVWDDAVVWDNAMVYGDAEVYGDARIHDDAKVFGNAMVYGDAAVFGNAMVYGDAKVFGNARIRDDAKVWGNAMVYGDANVYGDADVWGNAKVSGDAKVCGDAHIFEKDHVLVIGPIGSRNDYTTFMRNKRGEILVKCGCFLGTADEFLTKVQNTHGDSKHAVVYRAAVALAVDQIDTTPETEDEISATNHIADDACGSWIMKRFTKME
ncbi:MAG: hypothetical protein PUI99_07645 [Clostridiales bacterium]|nr:hypothetical protein [Clostridiales bacterium]